MIDIKGIDKVEILRSLYDRAQVQGMGFLNYRPGGLSREEAETLISQTTYFDYLYGRVMKVELSGDSLDPRLYDRDNGHGAASSAVTDALDVMTKPEALR